MTSIEDHVTKYKELCKKFFTTQTQLNNLLTVKDSIEDSRFEQQRKEYQDELDILEPQMNEFKEVISSAVSEQEMKKEQLTSKINTLKNKISQEDNLVEARAISIDRYKSIVDPLKRELEQLQLKARKITDNITFLKDALSSCTEEKAFSLADDSAVDVYVEEVSSEAPIESVPDGKAAIPVAGVYILYLLSLFLPFLSIVGVVIAYVFKGNAGEVLRSHYRFQIRTFWMWFLYACIGLALTLVFIGWLILLFVFIWLLVRCIVGLKCLYERKPVPNPGSWMFGT